MTQGANVTVRLPTLTDAAVQNATSPAGYSMHIRISWENFIEVYDSRKALCSFVSDCPLIEGNVTLVHTQTVPNYALGGSYRYVVNMRIFCPMFVCLSHGIYARVLYVCVCESMKMVLITAR